MSVLMEHTVDADTTFVPWYAGTPLKMETAWSLPKLRARRMAARKLRVERIRTNIAASPSQSMFSWQEKAA